jgi:hypothetical protein
MSPIVLPSDENTWAAEFGLKAMKKIRKAMPSQVRTFLIMAGLLLRAGDGHPAAVLTVSASLLCVNVNVRLDHSLSHTSV